MAFISLFEVRGAAFKPLALVTFGNIFYFAALKEGLHFYFPSALAEKFLR
jgi:hypothetical protein